MAEAAASRGAENRITLPPEPSSPAAARRFVRGVLQASGERSCSDAVILLTSELVTNAVRHAHTDCTVEVSVRTGVVRVEVSDGSPMTPSMRAADPTEESGRGLALVDLLSEQWGAEAAPAGTAGKRVWFAVRATGA